MIDQNIIGAGSLIIYIVLMAVCSLYFGPYVGPFIGAILGIAIIFTIAVITGYYTIPVCGLIPNEALNSTLIKNNSIFFKCAFMGVTK